MNFGYIPHPEETERIVAAMQYPSLSQNLPHLMRQATPRDVYLWKPYRALKPSWRRGSQANGSCVGWGYEWCCTALMGMQAHSGQSEWIEEGAPEAVYGLRAEIDPRNFANYTDGWYGSSAAKALQEYGILCRIDYSSQTGNPEHDLRKYDGKKEKEWGRYGLGGKDDGGKLDAIAKQFPVRGVTRVTKVEEAAAAIDAGCPIAICSNVGFGSMKRNNDGIVRRSGSWAHCMALGGIRYRNGAPEFRIIQSWGKSCSGPDPGIEDQAISDCSWWAVAEDIQAILSQDDSFALSRVEGFALPPWDFGGSWLV